MICCPVVRLFGTNGPLFGLWVGAGPFREPGEDARGEPQEPVLSREDALEQAASLSRVRDDRETTGDGGWRSCRPHGIMVGSCRLLRNDRPTRTPTSGTTPAMPFPTIPAARRARRRKRCFSLSEIATAAALHPSRKCWKSRPAGRGRDGPAIRPVRWRNSPL